jgi:hypothetical protein
MTTPAEKFALQEETAHRLEHAIAPLSIEDRLEIAEAELLRVHNVTWHEEHRRYDRCFTLGAGFMFPDR